VSDAPKVCLYCDGAGHGSAGPCGFCRNGKPLDTQEDWDRTWGATLDRVARKYAPAVPLSDVDQETTKP